MTFLQKRLWELSTKEQHLSDRLACRCMGSFFNRTVSTFLLFNNTSAFLLNFCVKSHPCSNREGSNAFWQRERVFQITFSKITRRRRMLCGRNVLVSKKPEIFRFALTTRATSTVSKNVLFWPNLWQEFANSLSGQISSPFSCLLRELLKTLYSTLRVQKLRTRFFYKNNFIRTTRLKFGQKLRTT